MNSKTYWERREEEALKKYIADEKEYQKQLEEIHRDMLDSIEKEIESFYGKYAKAEGITISEAKKRVSQADIEAYERKAKRYVKENNFSEQANEEMRLYNATMKINRLELLKANIGLELVAGHDELDKFMGEILQGRTVEELERQAGILGNTIKDNGKTAEAIVNASFHNAKFSDRIWMYQDSLKGEMSKIIQSGLIQGKSSKALAKELRKTVKTSVFNSERLMRSELARVQTEAQKQSFKANGFEEYEFHANSSCCDTCQSLDGKHFKVEKMVVGENAPPLHPNCRCSTSAWEDSKEYDDWLDFLNKGGTTKEWQKLNLNIENALKNGIIMPRDKFVKYALDKGKAPDKSRAFKDALGYEISNSSELVENILQHIGEFEFVEKSSNGYGMRYECVMQLVGANGKEANVLTAWIDDGNKKRLTSIYVTKKKRSVKNENK